MSEPWVNIRSRFGALEKIDAGYRLPIAKYGPENTQVFTWVTHDFGKAAVALLTNYADPSKGVLGKSYPVVTFRVTHPEFATAITKGASSRSMLHPVPDDTGLTAIKKEVTFVPLETAGLAEMDEMVHSRPLPCFTRCTS